MSDLVTSFKMLLLANGNIKAEVKKSEPNVAFPYLIKEWQDCKWVEPEPAVDKYFMGADFDGNEFAMSIMKKTGPDSEYVCIYSGRTTEGSEFEKEVERIAKFYNIPAWQIMKETR